VAKVAQPKKPQLTGQQEIFAREYVACGVATKAYRRAYNIKEDALPETHWQQASRLMASPKVRARVAAIQEEHAEVKAAELVAGFRQIRDRALETDELPSANTAIANLGKLKGYFKDDPAKAGDIHIHFGSDAKGLL
jgi:phage terminase small subunit